MRTEEGEGVRRQSGGGAMDQKPPAVPRASWRWGEEQGRGAPPHQGGRSEKRTLSAEYDLCRVGMDPLGGMRGVSEPPLPVCRSATASPLPSHAAPRPLRVAASLNCSLEELSARQEDLEKKREMVQSERLREQETQRREQVRLEEILNMCAEYERQVQWERDQRKVGSGAEQGRSVVGTPWQQRVAMAHAGGSWGAETAEDELDRAASPRSSSSSPTSPPPHQAAPPSTPPVALGSQSVHQNRIKTNGSLPRDKQRNLAGSSSAATTPPTAVLDGHKSSTPSPDAEEFPFGFNFDAGTFRHGVPHTTNSLPRHFPRVEGGGEGKEAVVRNGIVPSAASPPTSPTYPQSPRTRIRTNAASKASPSSPPPLRDGGSRAGVTSCESEGDGPQRALLLLPLSPGRLFGGTLPRSAMPCSREANGARGAEGAGARKQLPVEVEGEAEELKRERGKLLVALAAFKRKMNDIERHQEEALRELEMEQALLEGELNAVTEKVAEEELRTQELVHDLALHECKAAEQRESTLRQLSDCQRKVEEAQLATQWLESNLLSNKDPEKVESLRMQLKHQQETLEAERKVYEDLEFQQLEREAWWEAGREEMSREVSEVSLRARGRRHHMEHLEGAKEEAKVAAQAEASRIQTQRDMLQGRLNQGRHRLKVVEKRLSDLSRMGVNVASWDCSPDGSSDPDESPPVSSTGTTISLGVHALPLGRDQLPPAALSTSNHELLSSSQGSSQRKQSQDDLDRISRVTSGAPIDVSSGGSLGRRTIESLRTIERNRQIHLVQQGSQVIEEERRRVEELKRRAQDEVRAKWEEGRFRVHASGSNADASRAPRGNSTVDADHLPCNGSTLHATQGSAGDIEGIHSESLNSIGSEGEDSSVTESSDAPAESTTSSEEAEARGRRLPGAHGGECPSTGVPKMTPTRSATSVEQVHGANSRAETQPEGQRKAAPELACSRGEGARPVSDASSEGGVEGGGGDAVRRRTASTGRLLGSVQHQRPLTRYLPIRGQQLDLRAHMEWAGHQPDLCPHIQLSESVCRGHLLKVPASVSALVVRRASSSSFGGRGGRGGALLSGLRGGGWARRWFVFDRTARCFSYYTDSSEKKSRCMVDFEAIEDVYVDHLNSVKSPSPRLTFCVKTRERTFHLVAPSAEAMRIWVDVLFTGAEGYTGFEYVT